MKKIALLLLIIATVNSCQKTVTALTMIGTWKVDSYYENGADQTTTFKNIFVDYRIEFDLSNNYIVTYKFLNTPITNAGSWKLVNSGNDIEMIDQATAEKTYFRILEIKANSAQVTQDNKEYHLLKL